MKNILLIKMLAVSFGLAIAASSANAAMPGRTLQGAQARFVPTVVIPGSQACVPSPPLPKRSQAGITSKC
jgi:hypothetical protein